MQLGSKSLIVYVGNMYSGEKRIFKNVHHENKTIDI